MLNPPLSILSDDLLDYIVEHLANLPSANIAKTDLRHLSLTDRAFTRSCQMHIFKDLRFGYRTGKKADISEKLATVRKLLDDNPSYADRIRNLYIGISHKRNKWLFSDPTFISILQLLAKSPAPLNKVTLFGFMSPLTLEDPAFVVARLTQSFIPQTLTTLYLVKCTNIPLTLFLACPKLRSLMLFYVQVAGEREDTCSGLSMCGGEPPAPEHLNCMNSHRFVTQMITPSSPQLHMGVIRWSNLRTLKLNPRDTDEMACLQVILDAACNTLEELYLDHLPRHWHSMDDMWFPLALMANLKSMSQLCILSLYTIIGGARDPQMPAIHDICILLGTIPPSNKVARIQLVFNTMGIYRASDQPREDWEGLCGEVVRISAQKHLEFCIEYDNGPPSLKHPTTGLEEWHDCVLGGLASLFEYRRILVQFQEPPVSG